MPKPRNQLDAEDFEKLKIPLDELNEEQLVQYISKIIMIIRGEAIRRVSAREVNVGGARMKESRYLEFLLVNFLFRAAELPLTNEINLRVVKKVDESLGIAEAERPPPTEEIKRLEEDEIEAIEYIIKIKKALYDDVELMGGVLNKLRFAREKCRAGIAAASDRPFSVDKVIDELKEIIEKIADHLRDKIHFEEELKHFSKQLLKDLKNIDREQAHPDVMGHLRDVVEGRGTAPPESLMAADREELRRDMKKMRNAMFILALMSKKVVTRDDDWELAYAECCILMLRNPTVNDTINKYFERIKKIEDYLEAGKYKEHFNALNDFLIKSRNLVRFMVEKKDAGRPKEALTGPDGARNVLDDLFTKLQEKEKEIKKFMEDVDAAVGIFSEVRRFVIDEFQLHVVEKIRKFHEERPTEHA